MMSEEELEDADGTLATADPVLSAAAQDALIRTGTSAATSTRSAVATMTEKEPLRRRAYEHADKISKNMQAKLDRPLSVRILYLRD